MPAAPMRRHRQTSRRSCTACTSARDATPELANEGLRARPVLRGLNGFFKIESLQALREVALRQVAEDVEVVRRAWRSSQRLGAELDILVVRDPTVEPSAAEREQLESLRRIASALGAQLIIEQADDLLARSSA